MYTRAPNTAVVINISLENNFYITKLFPKKLLGQLYQSNNEQFYSMHAYVLAYIYVCECVCVTGFAKRSYTRIYKYLEIQF